MNEFYFKIFDGIKYMIEEDLDLCIFFAFVLLFGIVSLIWALIYTRSVKK